MTKFLYADDLSRENFIRLVQRFSFSESWLLMAFTPGKAVFESYVNDENLWSETDHGRIFSAEGELKWRWTGDTMRTVFLGTIEPPAGLVNFSPELDGLKSNTCQYFLWGTKTQEKGPWIEMQVPHHFEFPISDPKFSKGRIVLVIEHWNDNSDMTKFSRYHSLIENWEKPNADK